MARRPYTPWEIMMISEWVAKTFPDVKYQTNVRLGVIQPRLPSGTYSADEAKALGLWRRRIDALVYLPDRLLLIEAVLRADPGKISILKLYERLVPLTPELAEYRALPIQKILLYAIEDPALNVLAKEEGILPIQYVPTFFEQWFNKLRQRDKRTPQTLI